MPLFSVTKVDENTVGLNVCNAADNDCVNLEFCTISRIAQLFNAQVGASTLNVDIKKHDVDLLTNRVEFRRCRLGRTPCEVADVYEPLETFTQFDEKAEIHNAGDVCCQLIANR